MKKRSYVATLLVVMTCILLLPTMAMAAQTAPTLLPEDWNAGAGYGSAQKQSDNVVLLKGDAAVNDNSHNGPYVNTKAGLLENGAVVDEVNIYIDPATIAYGEKFQVSVGLNDTSNAYLTEIRAPFWATGTGSVAYSVPFDAGFSGEITEAAMYTLRFQYIPEGADILGNFTLLKNGVEIATTINFSLPGVNATNAKGRRSVWFVDISVDKGLEVYSVAMASYTKVDAALLRAGALNKNDYTNFSAVEAAIAAVTLGKNAAEQTTVDAYATAIDAAIDALVYKDADYSQVATAIAKANALDKIAYTNFSVVDAAINAVVYGKNITEQATVDSYAAAINAAIDALELVSTAPNPSPSPSPSPSVPPTGDANNISIWFVVLLSGMLCWVVSSAIKKRKN